MSRSARQHFVGLGKEPKGPGNTRKPSCGISRRPRKQQEATMTRIALVTGASRGLGRNTALRTARRGGDIAITYHSRSYEAQEGGETVRAKGRGQGAPQARKGAE